MDEKDVARFARTPAGFLVGQLWGFVHWPYCVFAVFAGPKLFFGSGFLLNWVLDVPEPHWMLLAAAATAAPLYGAWRLWRWFLDRLMADLRGALPDGRRTSRSGRTAGGGP